MAGEVPDGVNKAGIWETSGQEQAERGLNFAYLVSA